MSRGNLGWGMYILISLTQSTQRLIREERKGERIKYDSLSMLFRVITATLKHKLGSYRSFLNAVLLICMFWVRILTDYLLIDTKSLIKFLIDLIKMINYFTINEKEIY
jgi:hypothetical protein